jgi:hypothetical protein
MSNEQNLRDDLQAHRDHAQRIKDAIKTMALDSPGDISATVCGVEIPLTTSTQRGRHYPELIPQRARLHAILLTALHEELSETHAQIEAIKKSIEGGAA